MNTVPNVWMRIIRILLLCVVLSLSMHSIPSVWAAQTVTPRVAMLDFGSDGAVTVTIEVGGTEEPNAAVILPDGTIVRRDESGRMGSLLEQLVVPYETSEVLEFRGVLDATQVPTLTPYRRVTPASGNVVQRGTTLELQPASKDSAFMLSITCPQCAAGWYSTVLSQLPAYAPVLVLADGVADCTGLWRVRADRTQAIDATLPARVVTLLTVQDAAAVDVCQIGTAQTAAITAPVRVVIADGTQTLLRVVVCLVGVLLLSVASFYGALALTKRMHSAVGFRRDDR